MTPEQRRQKIAEAEALLKTVEADEGTSQSAQVVTVPPSAATVANKPPTLWETMMSVAKIMKGKA